MAVPPTPVVNGVPTTLHRLTSLELAQSPLLQPLVTLINAAFERIHVPPFFRENHPQRYSSAETLIADLDSTSAIFILTQRHEEHETRVLGSVTEEQYSEPTADHDGDDESPFKTLMWQDARPCQEDVDYRDMRLLVVDPSLQGQGLAAWLLACFEAHTKLRLEKESLERQRHWTGAQLLLVCILEIQGRYYHERGWTVVAQRSMPPGFRGIEGFTIVRMEKAIQLRADAV